MCVPITAAETADLSQVKISYSTYRVGFNSVFIIFVCTVFKTEASRSYLMWERERDIHFLGVGDWVKSYEPTPKSRVLDKLIVAHLIKNVASSGTKMFVTVFTKAHHWTPSWARWIHLTRSHPVSLRSLLTKQGVPFKLCLPFRSSDQKCVCIFHLSWVLRAQPISSPFDLIT